MQKNKTKRFLEIDVLRGIASLAVAYFHLSGSSGLSKDIATTGKYGYLGVEIFFVISGFVIPLSMYNSKYKISDFFTFLLKRILRINPPYFVIIMLALLLMYITKRPIPSIISIFAHIGYLNQILSLDWISPVFWTLALEFQFYFLIGFLYYFLVEASEHISLLTIGLILLSAFFLPPVYLPHWFGPFALGILIFKKQKLKMDKIIFWFASAIIVIIIVFLNGIPEAIISSITIFYILLVRFTAKNIFIDTGVLLGTISYALYLTHWDFGRTAVSIARHIPNLGNSETFRLCFGLVFSVIFAWVFYKLIELPFLNLSKYIKSNSLQTP